MFLKSGDDIKEKISQLITEESAGCYKFAVAYWGTGAVKMLPCFACQILCDLSSGSTNPYEIEKILHSNDRIHNVKQLNDLHAKVMLTSNGAVVSSANFSANGMGINGEESLRLKEAGYFVSASTSAFKDISIWFDEKWAEGKWILPKDISLAKSDWDKRIESKKPSEPFPIHALLNSNIKPGSPLRVATIPFLEYAKTALPNMRSNDVGKVAVWAAHLISAEAGMPLSYRPKTGNHALGVADENWLIGRMKQIKGGGYSPTLLLIGKLANDMSFGHSVQYWAKRLIDRLPYSGKSA